MQAAAGSEESLRHTEVAARKGGQQKSDGRSHPVHLSTWGQRIGCKPKAFWYLKSGIIACFVAREVSSPVGMLERSCNKVYLFRYMSRGSGGTKNFLHVSRKSHYHGSISGAKPLLNRTRNTRKLLLDVLDHTTNRVDLNASYSIAKCSYFPPFFSSASSILSMTAKTFSSCNRCPTTCTATGKPCILSAS